MRLAGIGGDIRRVSIDIGIGSWRDKEYVGLLYPAGLPEKERLNVYPQYFGHVELNAGYHAIPRREQIAEWEQRTPADFIFDVKLQREFSEDPRGATERGLVERTLESVGPLISAKKLGVFLLVLAPGFGPERHELAELDALIEKLRPHTLAVELRHNGWVDDERRERTLEYFRAHQLVWVAVDMPRIEGSTIMPPMDEMTNPRLAYLRLHGRNPNWFQAKDAKDRHDYQYAPGELTEIAGRIKALAEKAERVRVVANNHCRDFAPRTALALKAMFNQPLPKTEPRQGELF